jgi:hypothetical protein
VWKDNLLLTLALLISQIVTLQSLLQKFLQTKHSLTLKSSPMVKEQPTTKLWLTATLQKGLSLSLHAKLTLQLATKKSQLQNQLLTKHSLLQNQSPTLKWHKLLVICLHTNFQMMPLLMLNVCVSTLFWKVLV